MIMTAENNNTNKINNIPKRNLRTVASRPTKLEKLMSIKQQEEQERHKQIQGNALLKNIFSKRQTQKTSLLSKQQTGLKNLTLKQILNQSKRRSFLSSTGENNNNQEKSIFHFHWYMQFEL